MLHYQRLKRLEPALLVAELAHGHRIEPYLLLLEPLCLLTSRLKRYGWHKLVNLDAWFWDSYFMALLCSAPGL